MASQLANEPPTRQSRIASCLYELCDQAAQFTFAGVTIGEHKRFCFCRPAITRSGFPGEVRSGHRAEPLLVESFNSPGRTIVNRTNLLSNRGNMSGSSEHHTDCRYSPL